MRRVRYLPFDKSIYFNSNELFGPTVNLNTRSVRKRSHHDESPYPLEIAHEEKPYPIQFQRRDVGPKKGQLVLEQLLKSRR